MVQQRFIEAAYHWNMQFNQRKNQRDSNVVFKGTSFLGCQRNPGTEPGSICKIAQRTLMMHRTLTAKALNVQRAKVLELGRGYLSVPPEQAFLIATQQHYVMEQNQQAPQEILRPQSVSNKTGDLALVKEIRLNRHNPQVQQFLQLLHSRSDYFRRSG